MMRVCMMWLIYNGHITYPYCDVIHSTRYIYIYIHLIHKSPNYQFTSFDVFYSLRLRTKGRLVWVILFDGSCFIAPSNDETSLFHPSYVEWKIKSDIVSLLLSILFPLPIVVTVFFSARYFRQAWWECFCHGTTCEVLGNSHATCSDLAAAGHVWCQVIDFNKNRVMSGAADGSVQFWHLVRDKVDLEGCKSSKYVWSLCMMISCTGHCKLNNATLAENSLFYCVANWPYGQGALPVVAWYEGVLNSLKFTVTSPNPQTYHNMPPTSCASKNNRMHTF